MKRELSEKNLKQAYQRAQRVNKKERKRKEKLDREYVLVHEITAKKLKLNKAGDQVSSIWFANELKAEVEKKENFSIIDKLFLPGHLVLTDRGFTIQE